MANIADRDEGAGERSSAPLRSNPFTRADEPVWTVTLWPHRSLSPEGFRNLMWFSAAAMALPIVALIGTPAAPALAPYAALALFALWIFFRVNYRRARLTEELRLWPDVIAVERREPRGDVRRWSANPYWVQVQIRQDAPLENYLTLRGDGREIELGAFLSPEERVALKDDLERALGHARATPAPT